jgi:murein DD-endopeptidase MepM/ murein hydrolase activator NlpD
MKRQSEFNLLIVHGDGSRILRLNLPRWVLWGSLLAVVLGVSTLGAIFGDYVSLKREGPYHERLRRQVAEQAALVNSFSQRTTELRKEISSWRELHARIWEPFGPDEKFGQQRSLGIGGGQAERDARSGQQGSSLSRELDLIEASVAEEGQSLRALEQFVTGAKKILASLPSRWPLRGAVNSGFGRRFSPWTASPEFHSGIDISANQGTQIKAPAAGTIIFAGHSPEYGNLIVVDHGQETKTLYGHLSRIHVAAGQTVTRGQLIGFSGNTGRSSGPHLHYEVQLRGQAVDPRGYLWN